MKKLLAILALAGILSTLGGVAAFAAHEPGHEDENLRVYYSEPLGTPDEVRVFQFQACAKVPSYAPLRCTEQNQGISRDQCVDSKSNRVNTGTIIKGCNTAGGTIDPIPGTSFPNVTQTMISAQDRKECAENPSNQHFVYAPVWGIQLGSENTDQPRVDQTLVWAGSGPALNRDEQPPPQVIAELFPSQTTNTLRLYKNAFCIKWDQVVDPGDAGGESDNFNDVRNRSIARPEDRARLNQAQQIANNLAQTGCNNSNTSQSFEDQFDIDVRSTPYNDVPTVSCTARYRIEGVSGVDIFTSYVGKIYRWAASVVGIISVLIITASGVQISMAGGDSAKIDSAKTRVLQSIVGLVILFLASLILYTINPGFFVG
ncbi:hypothetical protein COV82_05590 [Candidatus Peregrinibacteria bacterium CG11_big_fil_rev_8_21_14_0_20_46_8]|nr:MAG: hypothetical protein COV82_05590 [Candidatus Peregrinibacteria bacterium CG11_big_fil_rev_8_21_14_0_20_46_8]